MISKDIKDFKAGNFIQQLEYKSFQPEFICVQWLLSDAKLQALLSEADRSIGRLDAFSTLIPDIDFFIKMHITKEATVSSKIEGTQTSFEEALISESDINIERRDDWREVHNYIEAINNAIHEIKDIPISNRLIRQTHKVLLSHVRGKEKLPGEYRKSQNWIGSNLKQAIFVPPIHTDLPELMSDLEKFINAEEMQLPIQIPHLIKIAMIHYQFETIHPFLDGNGRIGRLLITLYLIDKKLLQHPTLYLSDFFERHRRDYYDNLMRVRLNHDMNQWIRFFLEGVIDTANRSISAFQSIIQLRQDIELNRLVSLGRKQKDAKILMNELYKHPILDGGAIAEILGVHATAANRMIVDFQNLGILKERTGFKRNRIYVFDEYIDLFR
jgi:Fic family protein